MCLSTNVFNVTSKSAPLGLCLVLQWSKGGDPGHCGKTPICTVLELCKYSRKPKRREKQKKSKLDSLSTQFCYLLFEK